MNIGKRLFDSSLARTLLTLIAATYIRLVYVTSRWTVVGGHFPAQFWDADRPFIMCFWHGRLFMLPCAWKRGKLIHILTSMHRDGRLIGGTVGQFGIKTIDGSSSRGGVAGLRAMIRKLKAGDWVGITPDGPRGPRMRASEGVVSLARMTNMPVIPVTFGARRRKVMGSWDRFVVALPFGRGVFVWGEPITVPHTAKKETLEQSRLQVEQALNAITAEADRLCGHDPIEPAQPADAP